MKCYKVVTANFKSAIIDDKEYINNNTSLYSNNCFYQILNNKYCIKYELNKIIESYNNTPIFCFKIFEDALNFRKYDFCFMGDYKILECIGYDKIKTPKMISGNYGESMLDLFYKKNVRNKKFYLNYSNVPEGTICFKKIKPIKLIQE